MREIITAPPGTKDAIWWVQESGDPRWVWYHRNRPGNDVWELRQRAPTDAGGWTGGSYVNMVWHNPDGPGWRFWDPFGKPGSAAICWRPTRGMAMRACVRRTERERSTRGSRWRRDDA